MNKNEYLLIGEIYREHGVCGGVLVYLYHHSLENFRKGMSVWIETKNGSIQKTKIVDFYWHKKWLVTQFEFLKHPEEVFDWRKSLIYIDRAGLVPLKKGEHYLQDLMGFQVEDYRLGLIGILDGFRYDHGGVEFYVIKTAKGSFFMPVNADWIREIISTKKLIRVDLPEGLIE